MRWPAVLGIICAQNIPGGQTPPLIQSAFAFGDIGYSALVVLSGIVLTLQYRERLERPSLDRIAQFTRARAFRILPLFAMAALWALFSARVGLGGADVHKWLVNPFHATAWIGAEALAVWQGPGWAVLCVLVLSCTVPVLMPLLRRPLRSIGGSVAIAAFGGAWTASTCVIAIARTWPVATDTAFPLVRLGEFLIGVGIAGIVLSAPAGSNRYRFIATLTVMGAVFLLIAWLGISIGVASRALVLAAGIPLGMLLLAIALTPRSWPARLLATRPLQAMGDAAYAMFIVQAAAGSYLVGGLLATGFAPLPTALFGLGILMLCAFALGLEVMVDGPARSLERRWRRQERARNE